jgi:hypothetical protein
LTKVPETELGYCPKSERDDKEEDLSKGCYAIPLVEDYLWTTQSGVTNNREPRDISDNSDDLPVAPHLHDQDVENLHGLYWKRDGELEAPVNKIADTRGRLKPEKVCNFGKHHTSFMYVFPLVYCKKHIQRNQ